MKCRREVANAPCLVRGQKTAMASQLERPVDRLGKLDRHSVSVVVMLNIPHSNQLGVNRLSTSDA